MSSEFAHSVRLFFPYTFDSNASPSEYKLFSDNLTDIKISDLLKRAPFLDNDVHDKFLHSELWQQSDFKLDRRIHSFADKLVNGIQNLPFSDGFFGMQPCRLSNDSIRVLNQGTPNTLGSAISISLKPSAVKRLAEAGISPPIGENAWPLMFNSVWLYGLNNGVGMMVIDLSFKQPTKSGLSIAHLAELQEINYVICRNSNDHQSALLNWGAQPNGDKNSGQSIKGLSELVDVLLPKQIGQSIKLNPTHDRNNTYSYTFVSTAQGIPEKDRKNYCFRLARKYNELYLPDNIEKQAEFFEPFRPITHVFSLEGAASYIDLSAYESAPPESIQNFDTAAIPQAYVPIVMLTYAEYIFLREINSNTPDNERVDMRNPTNENLELLREHRTKLYDFRLNFRYSQISGNTNHNIFCNANKKALEIKSLLSETSSDAQEIEQYIADHVSQSHDARIKKYGVLGSLFAVIIGWVDLWGLNLHSIIFASSKTDQSSILLFLGVLILLSASVIYLSRSPSTKKQKKKRFSKAKNIKSKANNE